MSDRISCALPCAEVRDAALSRQALTRNNICQHPWSFFVLLIAEVWSCSRFWLSFNERQYCLPVRSTLPGNQLSRLERDLSVVNNLFTDFHDCICPRGLVRQCFAVQIFAAQSFQLSEQVII